MNDLISIIIPHYNRWNLMMDTLLSIKEQTYNNYEIIIIDDCSTSKNAILELKKIEKLFKEKNFQIIYLKNNIWPAWARNKWIEVSKWKFIFCLDSDDKVYKLTLSKSIKILQKDDRIGFTYTHTKYVWEKEYISKRQKFNFKDLLFYDYIVISSLFRKECWEKVNWFDNNKKLEIEDWEFWINISKNGYVWKLINYVGCEILIQKNSYSSRVKYDLNKSLNYIQEKHKDLYKNNKIIYLEYYIPIYLRKSYRKITSLVPQNIKIILQKLLWKLL